MITSESLVLFFGFISSFCFQYSKKYSAKGLKDKPTFCSPTQPVSRMRRPWKRQKHILQDFYPVPLPLKLILYFCFLLYHLAYRFHCVHNTLAIFCLLTMQTFYIANVKCWKGFWVDRAFFFSVILGFPVVWLWNLPHSSWVSSC